MIMINADDQDDDQDEDDYDQDDDQVYDDGNDDSDYNDMMTIMTWWRCNSGSCGCV